MGKRFHDLVDSLESQCQALLTMVPIVAEKIPNSTPTGGVHLFSEGAEHLYTGRTKRKLAVRIRNHFGTARDCPFAWLLAREATGHQPTYTPKGSRTALLADPGYKAAYESAKGRIRRMDVRYIAEPDPVRRALLEIYVGVETEATYNSFVET